MPNEMMHAWVTSYLKELPDARPIHTALVAVIALRWETIGCPETFSITSQDLVDQALIQRRNLKKEIDYLLQSKILIVTQYSTNQYSNYEFSVSGKIMGAITKNVEAFQESSTGKESAVTFYVEAFQESSTGKKSAITKNVEAFQESSTGKESAITKNVEALGQHGGKEGTAITKNVEAFQESSTVNEDRKVKILKDNVLAKYTRNFGGYYYYKYNSIIKYNITTPKEEMDLYVEMYIEITGRDARAPDSLLKRMAKIFSPGVYALKDLEMSLRNFMKDEWAMKTRYGSMTVFTLLDELQLEKYRNWSTGKIVVNKNQGILFHENTDLSEEEQIKKYGQLED